MRALLVLLVLCCAAGSVRAEDGREEEAAKRREFEQALNERYDPEFRTRVHAAIDKGTRWLLAQQRPDGCWDSGHNSGYPITIGAEHLVPQLNKGPVP